MVVHLHTNSVHVFTVVVVRFGPLIYLLSMTQMNINVNRKQNRFSVRLELSTQLPPQMLPMLTSLPSPPSHAQTLLLPSSPTSTMALNAGTRHRTSTSVLSRLHESTTICVLQKFCTQVTCVLLSYCPQVTCPSFVLLSDCLQSLNICVTCTCTHILDVHVNYYYIGIGIITDIKY